MRTYFGLLLSLTLFSSIHLNAQNKYQELETKERVSFYYKLKPSKFLKKDSPLMVVFKIKNENDHAANTSFVVDYYHNAIILTSSEAQTFCLKPNKAMRGRIRNLAFDGSELSNEEIMSDNFVIELSEVSVVEVEACE